MNDAGHASASSEGGVDAGPSTSPSADAAVVRDAGTDAADAHACGHSDNLCPQICPKHLVLAGGTRNLGGCSGDCNFSVGFEFAPALEDLECVTAYADLVVQSSDGHRREAHARLTQEAWDEIGVISLALEKATIEPPPSCVNCSSKASVRFHPADAMQGLVYAEHEFPIGRPPAALQAADAFIQTLIDQLAKCQGAWITLCDVREIPDPPSSAKVCTFSYAHDGATFACNVPLDQEAPCRAAVECLCRIGALPNATRGVQVCADSWLSPRDAPTFTDFCTQGETDITSSLGHALLGFADANHYMTSSSDTCDQLLAVY